ncbi:MAG: MerR family transcriptional regulator [Janthinobacterium lividum]
MEKAALSALPLIPAKRYFTIGEVSELCGVKPHVLRYWEQEFTQLKPVKRRGNRRYYQHHEVLLIRRIRDLLYEQGFTINGARNRLAGQGAAHAAGEAAGRSGDGESGEAGVDLAALRGEIVEVLLGLGGMDPDGEKAMREEYAESRHRGDDRHA